jgi:hypothetical protein
MEVVNLLEFLNTAKAMYTLDYATCEVELINFLNLIARDEQFTQKIDLGILYYQQRNLDSITIVDGLNRILSLTLLLHAVCECYKKTSTKNDKAIKTIRMKYILNGASKTKLRLATATEQEIFDKIIFGEKLSGKEKEHPMFVLLHNFWSQIKEEKLLAANIFKMLAKVVVMTVSVGDIPARSVYYNLNKMNRELNQLALIGDYLKSMGLFSEWNAINKIFLNKESDVILFLNDFFITKFNLKNFNKSNIYESFQNYFETMLQYMPEDTLVSKIKESAILYNNILNVNIENENIKRALINIKMHGGEDTYSYLLSIYEDYVEGNITEATFIEIMSTIDEYLIKRTKSPNNVSFNELISYLNAFITCK